MKSLRTLYKTGIYKKERSDCDSWIADRTEGAYRLFVAPNGIDYGIIYGFRPEDMVLVSEANVTPKSQLDIKAEIAESLLKVMDQLNIVSGISDGEYSHVSEACDAFCDSVYGLIEDMSIDDDKDTITKQES